MINMPNKYHFTIRPLITYYLITLLIYIQLYLLPYLIYPKTYTTAMTFYKINTDRISAIFFILPFFLLFQKPKDYLRERPKFIYLLIYPVFCGIYFIYFIY